MGVAAVRAAVREEAMVVAMGAVATEAATEVVMEAERAAVAMVAVAMAAVAMK